MKVFTKLVMKAALKAWLGLLKAADTQSVPIKGTSVNGNEVILFKSSMEAGRKGFIQSSISLCCSGKQKYHKGFYWEKITKDEYKKAFEK